MKIDVKKFINENLKSNPSALRLKYIKSGMEPEERSEIEQAILQIEARRKYSSKLIHLLKEFPDFIFPDMLACEQASNDSIAIYHSSLTSFFNSLIDMTAGLGTDFIFMAKSIFENSQITGIEDIKGSDRYSGVELCCEEKGDCTYLAIEMNPRRAEILRDNLKASGTEFEKQTQIKVGDSIEIIKELPVCNPEETLIYVDPARRGGNDSRIYNPADCQPDIIGNMESLFRHADTIMIKNSPMLDVDEAFRIFPGASEIHIVSVRNECKEVLAICKSPKINSSLPNNPNNLNNPNNPNNPILIKASKKIICINIAADSSISRFEFDYDSEAGNISYVQNKSELKIGGYLYEPNASLMKCGRRGWIALQQRFPGLRKLSPNCNLFYSEERIAEFPGRATRIDSLLTKADRKSLKGKCYNIVCRNYPLTAEKLAESLKLKSSPTDTAFIYAATITTLEDPLLLKNQKM